MDRRDRTGPDPRPDYRYLSGRTYAASRRFSLSQINYPITGGRQPLLEPLGSRRVEALSALDLRAEKIFNLGDDRISVYADLTNVFNAGTVTRVLQRFPSTTIGGIARPVPFGAPAAITPARALTLGARWSF